MPKRPPSRTREEKLKGALMNRLHSNKAAVKEGLEKYNLAPVDEPAAQQGVDVTFKTFDLVKLSSRMIGRYMQYASGMQSYCLAALANESCMFSAIDEALDSHISKLTLLFSSGQPKWKVKLEIDEDTTVQKLRAKRLTQEAVVEALSTHAKIWESRVSLLSRELTRRSSEQGKGL